MGKIYDEPYPISIEDRKAFLKKRHIGLYDVIEECDINNIEDASIRNAIPVDIEGILDRYPNIDTIGITGKKAAALFDKHLKDKVNIKIIYLPSTSPTNAGMKEDELIKYYKELMI